MRGISSSTKTKIHELVDDFFDRMSLRLLGEIPSLRGKKSIIFTSKPDFTLAHLFMKGLETNRPLPAEVEAMKNLLSTAEEYVKSLRAKTKAQLTEKIDAYVKEKRMKGFSPSTVDIKEHVEDAFKSARSHFKTIAEAESTKARNMGKAMNIGRVAASQNVQDPNVFFVVVKDNVTCKECIRLHLMPDKVTPKVWKLSEVKFSYHKKGEDSPSVAGLHPHCFTENMMLHTDKGLASFKDLFEKQGKNNVVVDSRIENRKFPANQFGIEIPNTVKLNRHSDRGAKILPATHVYYTGDQECYRITLTSGQTIEVSHGHDMWVDDNKCGIKVRAKDIKVGDRIPILQINQGYFGSDNFPELAELMGNLMGDGSITDKAAMWNFFGNDIEYGKKLFEMTRKYGVKSETTLLIRPPNAKYAVESAKFSNYQLQKIFKNEFGLSKKPRRIPKRLWSADKETIYAFLRGLYAADGHSEKEGIVLGQNDLEFLKEVQLLLSMAGFTSRIFDSNPEHEKEIAYADGRKFATKRKQSWRLRISDMDLIFRFYKEIGMGVPVKQARLGDFIDKNYRSVDKRTQFSWRTARVEKIENIGIKPTYCLTEPSLNTVTVNGIVTGQCRCSLSFLAPNFGFKNGQVSYIAEGHDEYKAQRS